jgi:hypothetical protein
MVEMKADKKAGRSAVRMVGQRGELRVGKKVLNLAVQRVDGTVEMWEHQMAEMMAES